MPVNMPNKGCLNFKFTKYQRHRRIWQLADRRGRPKVNEFGPNNQIRDAGNLYV
jgi:hypothetical protein